MEYYILKSYQKAKNERGLGKRKVSCLERICLTIMIISSMVVIVTLFFENNLLKIISCGICAVATVVFDKVDNYYTNKYMGENVQLHKDKLKILENILIKEYSINTDEKMKELIDIYQKYLDREQEKETKKNNTFITVYSSISVILTTLLGRSSMNFASWVYLAVDLFFLIAVFRFLIIYTDRSLLSIDKYEMMIKDIRDLLLMRRHDKVTVKVKRKRSNTISCDLCNAFNANTSCKFQGGKVKTTSCCSFTKPER